MKTIGIANHFNNKAVATAMPTKINFGKLLFILKSLNFNAIRGSLDTIRKLNKIINPYKNHLFIKIVYN